jgi:hypothetical protein
MSRCVMLVNKCFYCSFRAFFSNVWGPAPKSVGRKQYYVSFIDDFNKYIWIYPLKYKSKVFQKFREILSSSRTPL